MTVGDIYICSSAFSIKHYNTAYGSALTITEKMGNWKVVSINERQNNVLLESCGTSQEVQSLLLDITTFNSHFKKIITEKKITLPFHQFAEYCRYSHGGFDIDRNYIATCKNKENIPFGHSYGECNASVCPALKGKIK